MKMQSKPEQIVLGGGCFWCTEAVFRMVEGVKGVTPGYAGGTTDNPTYEAVCRGDTGHAEVISIEYDPGRASLEKLLDIFFTSHDPTSLNRQGNDIGTQYRSIILYTTAEQKVQCEEFIDSIRGRFDKPIVTEIEELERFYPAETYHERYYERNSHQPYCKFVISPKVEKARKKLGLPG